MRGPLAAADCGFTAIIVDRRSKRIVTEGGFDSLGEAVERAAEIVEDIEAGRAK